MPCLHNLMVLPEDRNIYSFTAGSDVLGGKASWKLTYITLCQVCLKYNIMEHGPPWK